MKTFFAEFKTFITRGNVVDMSVGVIVGGAFTAIVNGMGNFILKPIVNWILAMIFGANSLNELFTFLKKVEAVDEAGNVIAGEIDLANSIYIDWGAFINAVLSFLITAFVLFLIVRFINKTSENHSNQRMTRKKRKELKANGIRYHDRAAVAAYFAAQKKAEEEAAAEKARKEREENPTTEDLLKAILAEMQKN